MRREKRHELVIGQHARRDWLDLRLLRRLPPREFDLRVQGQRAPFGSQADLPALRRLRLLRRADLTHRDAAALERQPQRGPFQDLADLLLQRVDCHSLDVEVDVLRISDALEEEAQVAATLDGEAILVRPQAEEADEVEVEQLHHLAGR